MLYEHCLALQRLARRALVGGIAAGLLVLPGVSWAQEVGSPATGTHLSTMLDAGFGNVHVDGYAASQAATLATRVWTATSLSDNTQLNGGIDGVLSRFVSGHLVGYVDAFAALDLDSATLLRPTVAMSGGTGAYRGQVTGQYLSAELRLGRPDAVVAGATSLGWWATGGIGMAGVGRPYDTRHAVLGTSAGWRAFSAALSADLTHAGDSTYTDAVARIAVQSVAGVHAELTAGLRSGANVVGRRRWADVAGVFPLLPYSAIVVSAGAAPLDAEHAAVGARYASIALRLTFGAATTHASPALPGVSGLTGTVVSTIQPDGSRTLTLTVPNARTVEVMGDFTDWEAVPMTRAPNGIWTARVVLAPGSHRMDIRVDGGLWSVPPGLPAAPDDFGGSVGLLVVR